MTVKRDAVVKMLKKVFGDVEPEEVWYGYDQELDGYGWWYKPSGEINSTFLGNSTRDVEKFVSDIEYQKLESEDQNG